MNSIVIVIAVSILLAALGLVAWAWLVMSQVEGDLRSVVRFEARHFEIGPQAIRNAARLA